MLQSLKTRRLSPFQIALLFAALNLIWRLVWLPFSQGAYTDGILQIDLFRQGLTYWPPLYALAAHAVALTPGLGLEGAGRLISVLAGALAVFPIELIARRLFGRRAAVMALLVWTAGPMPLRWSVQVMTDMPFTALWIAALAAAVEAARAYWPELFAAPDASASPAEPRLGFRLLMLGSLAGVLASLTRYQGIFLMPVFAALAWRAGRRKGEAPLPWLSLSIWLALPLWLLRQGPAPLMIHFTQIGERAAPGSIGQTLLHYLNLFETFVLTAPYYATWGLFGFFLYGLARTQFATRRLRLAAWAGLYLALAILALQAVFQAFQTRYLLPLIPLVSVVAGHGLAVWERRWRERPVRFWALAGPTLAYALIFSSLVAYFQGSPFVDIKQAGLMLAGSTREEASLFTNERYNAQIAAPKLRFWSGKPADRVTLIGARPAEPGDYVIVSSFYAGSWERYVGLVREYEASGRTEKMASFGYVAYPLLPDLMQNAMFHPNPLAFNLRYTRQHFATTIFKVVDVPSFEEMQSFRPPAEGEE